MSSAAFKNTSFLESLINDDFIRKSAVLAASHGVHVYEHITDRQRSKIAPIAAVPTAFAGELYSKAAYLSKLSTYLVDRMSVDSDFISKHLRETARVDDFTKRLMNIFEEVYVSGPKRLSECPRLHVLRTDWMIDSASETGSTSDNIKQVEINTVSCAFAGLAQLLSDVHRTQVSDILYRNDASAPSKEPFNRVAANACPENRPAERIGEDLAHAQEMWRLKCCPETNSLRPVVLYLVTADERNEVDQRLIEQSAEKKGLEVARVTMQDLQGRLTLEDSCNAGRGQTLFVTLNGKQRVVSVVYWRAAYDPAHYLSDEDWGVRSTIEKATAVLVPSVPTQLVGAKKIQQVLSSKANLLSLGLTDQESDDLLSSTALQFDPAQTDDATLAALDNAIINPTAWVLKPQREGGGNNLHEGELVAAVKAEIERKKLEGSKFASPYILMQKIRSAHRPTVFLHPISGPNVQAAIGELGIYTTLLIDGAAKQQLGKDAQEHSRGAAVGHVLRSKYASSNEGGVAKGYAVLDSPLLL